jgi:hypothetical protein
MAHMATPKNCLLWPISKQHFKSWDLALQPIVWQKTSASIQTRKCFQSSKGHNVSIVLHWLQSCSSDWHTIEGLWGPWHVMGFPISFGQFVTNSVLTPFFLWSSFLNVPKVRMCDVHLLWINMKVWEPQSEKIHGICA